jgi:hypothetical protein
VSIQLGGKDKRASMQNAEEEKESLGRISRRQQLDRSIRSRGPSRVVFLPELLYRQVFISFKNFFEKKKSNQIKVNFMKRKSFFFYNLIFKRVKKFFGRFIFIF